MAKADGEGVSGPPRVLFVLRPPVENYPPTLNQAALLVEHGFRVSVGHAPRSGLESASSALPAPVERHLLGRPDDAPGSLAARLLRVIAFRRAARRLVRRLRPDLVVAYDAEVCHALGDTPRRCGARLVWHFHELPEPQHEGRTVHLSNRFVHAHARLPDLIVFPDPGRAAVFARRASIDPAAIRVVANCPRPLRTPPEPTLRKALGSRVPDGAPVVLYHGAVGPDHALEVAVRSMPRWPRGAVFVIKGRARPDYARRLVEAARAAGVEDRLVLFDPGFLPYDEHYALVAGADVGWTVLEPVIDNWKYCSLASNKRFECMALGLPQVADRNPGVPDIVERNGCGLCIPHGSVEAAAGAVARLLGDPALRLEMARRGREAHLTLFNYDRQFQPVLEDIRRLTQEKGTGSPSAV